MSDNFSVTRGHGRIEHFLARRRAAIANRLIPQSARSGCILDVGCGSYPYFLSRTAFANKFGIDQVIASDDNDASPSLDGVQLQHFNIALQDRIPFEDTTFHVVTMLAVFEHIPKDRLVILLNEIERVLKPGGQYILTTPAGWADPILRLLTKIGMVSKVEIDEHQDCYNHKKIRAILDSTKFNGKPLSFGSFELGMNLWATIKK